MGHNTFSVSAFFVAENSSAQLQSRKTEERKKDRYYPETNHDLAFGPTAKFEVMMYRGNAKNSPAGELERRHLQDHRESLQYKHAPDHGKQEFLLDQHGHGSDRPAQRLGSHVTHEDLGWMSVVPEESHGSAHH